MKTPAVAAVLISLILGGSTASRAAHMHAMTGVPSGGMSPAWSPDGREIVYLGPVNPRSRYPTSVIAVSRDGTHKHTIVSAGRRPLGEARITQRKLVYSIEDSGLLRILDMTTGRRAVLGTVDLPPNPEEPFTVSRQGAIAFESRCGCKYPVNVVRVVAPGTTRARPLPRPANASDEQPGFSPNGRFIVFSRSVFARPDRAARGLPKLIVASANDGSERPLGVTGRLPAWSPDGKWIAYASSNPSSPSLLILPASGGNSRVVLHDAPGLDSFSWSPDSRRLVYETQTELGTVTVDGTRRAFDLPGIRPGFSTPQWSPDGKTIAFWGIFGPQAYNAGIYTIAQDGEQLRRVA
jgi:Tol biopolymer transport system component